jgi:hypothetical protein
MEKNRKDFGEGGVERRLHLLPRSPSCTVVTAPHYRRVDACRSRYPAYDDVLQSLKLLKLEFVSRFM